MNCAMSSTIRHLSLHTTGMQQSCPGFNELQLWDLDCLQQSAPELAGPAQQASITLSMYCNWRISMVIRTNGNCLCAKTEEMSTTLTQLECPQTAR